MNGCGVAWFVHYIVAPVYFPIANALILIFWHTNYAKRTVANYTGMHKHPSSHPLFGAFEIGTVPTPNS